MVPNKRAGLFVKQLLGVASALAMLGQQIEVQGQSDQDLGNTRQRLQELQLQIGHVNDQLSQLGKRRGSVLVELQSIALRASKARTQAEAAKLRRDEFQANLLLLIEKRTKTHAELNRLKESLRRQVKWLHALGPLGTLSFFPSHSDIENYLVRSRYLEWWRKNESRKLQKALSLHAELVEQEKMAADAEARLSEVSIEMATLQEELSANEKQLQAYLSGIQRDELQKREIQAELNEEAILLERMLASVLTVNRSDSTFRASTPFHNLLGSLPIPVEGTLAEGFGVQTHPRFGTKTRNSGLLIAAKGGSAVRAVADGQVVKAEHYQSYGLMVIIFHGNAYHSLYTHLRALLVKEGQIVKSGEIIGYVGDTPDGPRLGFEIRNRSAPEDPQKWLSSRYVPNRQ